MELSSSNSRDDDQLLMSNLIRHNSFDDAGASLATASTSTEEHPERILKQLVSGTVLETERDVFADLGEGTDAVALDDSCPICLVDYEHGEVIQSPPACRHFFHSHCIAEWLDQGTRECPCCRLRLPETASTAASVMKSSSWDDDFPLDPLEEELRRIARRSRRERLPNSSYEDTTTTRNRSGQALRANAFNDYDSQPLSPIIASPAPSQDSSWETPTRRWEGIQTGILAEDDSMPTRPRTISHSSSVATGTAASIQVPPSPSRSRSSAMDVDQEEQLRPYAVEEEYFKEAGHVDRNYTLKDRIRSFLDTMPGQPPSIAYIKIEHERCVCDNHCCLCGKGFSKWGRYTVSQDFHCMHVYHEECFLQYACQYLEEHTDARVMGHTDHGDGVKLVPCGGCARPYLCVPVGALPPSPEQPCASVASF